MKVRGVIASGRDRVPLVRVSFLFSLFFSLNSIFGRQKAGEFLGEFSKKVGLCRWISLLSRRHLSTSLAEKASRRSSSALLPRSRNGLEPRRRRPRRAQHRRRSGRLVSLAQHHRSVRPRGNDRLLLPRAKVDWAGQNEDVLWSDSEF